MNRLHGSPFTTDFTDYLGKFATLSCQRPSIQFDASTLPAYKRLSYNEHVCNFDFMFYLTLCNNIYGVMEKSTKCGTTTVSLMCDRINSDGTITEQSIALNFIHLGELRYCADIYFHDSNSNDGLITVVRMIRSGAEIKAYVTNANSQYQFSHCTVLQPDFTYGDVFNLTKTVRISKVSEAPLQIVGGAECISAHTALIRNLSKFFIDPMTIKDQTPFKEEDFLIFQLSTSVRTKVSKLAHVGVSIALEELLKLFYMELNTVRSMAQKDAVEPALLPLSDFPRLCHILTSIVKYFEKA